jgi:hypothetical protein
LPSFDSVIVPASIEELLSAQARIEYVPAAVKVFETEAVPVPPAAKAVMEVAPKSVMVPPPLAAEASWKKLLKLAPVEAAPVFEIVDENV